MMPRLAALSRAEISRRICSASGLAAPRDFFWSERRRERTPRFCPARASDCRERFAADFVFAILLESGVDGRADRQNVKMSVFPSADQARGPEATLTGEVSF